MEATATHHCGPQDDGVLGHHVLATTTAATTGTRAAECIASDHHGALWRREGHSHLREHGTKRPGASCMMSCRVRGVSLAARECMLTRHRNRTACSSPSSWRSKATPTGFDASRSRHATTAMCCSLQEPRTTTFDCGASLSLVRTAAAARRHHRLQLASRLQSF